MLNQGGITKVAGDSGNSILIAPELAAAFSCKVEKTATPIKAGQILWGDLTKRDTAFKTTGTGAGVGVALHDVDATAGVANASVLVFGFVDVNKLDDAVKTAITGASKPAGITLVG